jgi:hypothetical protein
MFSPTGLVGHGLGIIGTAMIVVGVIGYSMRKRAAFLERLGGLRYWLQVHIFLCTLGPFFVLLHTTFKFGGLVSVAFWSMAVVVASGIFGRYVYVRIPKTVNGRFLGQDAVEARTGALAAEIRATTDVSPEAVARLLGAGDGIAHPRSLIGALWLAMREDLKGRLGRRRLRRELETWSLPAPIQRRLADLVRERARLRQQTLLLHPFQRLFRYWHVVHLPLAIVMFLILGVHVTVSILFGYTWIF